ncbi:MAG: KOW motif-containing protein [Pseudobdellovibrionaceae bacterium]|jgi:large subunit ribosomal protein L24
MKSKTIKLKIKKGEQVQIIAGADKGKKGTVLEVLPKEMKLKIQGVRMQTHFDKKDGLLQKEGFIDYSNVKPLATTKEAKAKKAKPKTASKTT